MVRSSPTGRVHSIDNVQCTPGEGLLGVQQSTDSHAQVKKKYKKIYLPIYLSIYPTIYLSIYLSIYLVRVRGGGGHEVPLHQPIKGMHSIKQTTFIQEPIFNRNDKVSF